MICIFCHKDSSSSKSVEHIIPESLGNKYYYLTKGCVCDECNHYFAIKIEKSLLSQPYFVSLRHRNEILTKKGKLVRQKMFFPEALKSTEVTMQTTDKGIVCSFDNEELYKTIKEKGIHTMLGPYIPEPEYPNNIVSRFLAKCAYEYFLYTIGEDKYDICVKELLGKENDILRDLREYARYGKGRYWQYNQRRIYSEGDLFYNKSEDKNYEILHEMRFFTKEYNRHSNGMIDAEIYYVLVISGIEYAICISDPDISEYRNCLELNGGHSPLEDKTERQLPIGLSDFNPLLIKHTNKI